jgi:uridine kinase
MRNTLNRLLGILTSHKCNGIIIFVTGSKCCGKSSLVKEVEKNHDDVVLISFSTALQAFMNKYDTDSRWKSWINGARQLLLRKSKNIPFRLIQEAFREALKEVAHHKIIVVEGYLKKKNQCTSAPRLTAESCPHHMLVCVEAACELSIAHARAMKSGKMSASISAQQQEYQQLIPEIRQECKKWATYVEVSTEDSLDMVSARLTATFNQLFDEIREGRMTVTVSSKAKVAA